MIPILKTLGGIGALWGVLKTVLEWTGYIQVMGASVTDSSAWILGVLTVLNAPSQSMTLLITVVSFGVFGMLVLRDGKERPPGRWKHKQGGGNELDIQSGSESYPGRMGNSQVLRNQQFQEEWEQLEEGDREVLREIILKGGLLDSDIAAILQARGFPPTQDEVQRTIADRVCFLVCDYSGYHSVHPVCHAWLRQKILSEMRDESMAGEIR